MYKVRNQKGSRLMLKKKYNKLFRKVIAFPLALLFFQVEEALQTEI
jgi:hypothetical protein